VFGDILAGKLCIGRIYSYRDALGEHRSVVREQPLGSVETDYIDCCKLATAQRQQSPGKLDALIIVLLVADCFPFVLAFHGKCGTGCAKTERSLPFIN